MRARPMLPIAALALAPLLLSACTTTPTSADPTESAQSQSTQGASTLLASEHRSIAEIRGAVVSGDETAEEITRGYLDVIDAKDDVIGAIISLNPAALEQSKALDERIAAGEDVGVLAGVTFVVKDNYDVVGLPTTAGSIALANNYPATTSPAVQRLLDEDAILLGKTNMSEFAASYGRLGYSSMGGLTLNPANIARNASGSSSGTAAAIAAGMAVFGLGTDTSGSVRGPASVTGTVGVRPTAGLVPRTGVVPLSLSFDTVGAITTSVADQRILIDLLAGPDVGDPGSRPTPDGYTAGDETDDQDLRVGLVPGFMGGDPEVDDAVASAVNALGDEGVDVEEVDVPASFSTLWADVLGPVGDAEFATQFEDYLAGSPAGTVKTLDELIAFYESPGAASAANPINPARLDGLRVAQTERDSLDSAEVSGILETTVPAVRAAVQELLAARDLDALVFPTMSCVASPRFDVEDDTYTCESDDPYTASYLASAAGLPEATVPIGVDSEGLPIGLSFLGEAYSEGLLLDLGELLAK